LDEPDREPLDYYGHDPDDPIGPGLRNSTGEGVAAFCLSLVCPLVIVATMKLFATMMLCFGLPLSLFIACFVVRLAWHGLHGTAPDPGFAWAALAAVVLTFAGLVAWFSMGYA
jgi:predicted signal transduction protein with EAL and GGDEF domain